ncbi:hypothetical protein [Streptacidiphilus sp. P02-A3a]|uniref:hypothetical protein n=1 Tax=Streptacidiphilus sp. P02-A3a TaxID=2704468 RepID=UPI0015F84698|nr:hypothetical protein [Streptacidiphilus sp. P02-A3a]QMU71501.1 hypothetical protein GXP74_27970 [Streptacidiphilus sp. P02-A3a]
MTADPSTDTDLARIRRLVVESAEGGLTEAVLAAAGGSLQAVNYSSLSYIRMIDAIENDFGVYLDPEADIASFATVDGIAGLVAAQLAETRG